MYPYTFKLLDMDCEVRYDMCEESVPCQSTSEEVLWNSQLVRLYVTLGYQYMVVDTPVGEIIIDLTTSLCASVDGGIMWDMMIGDEVWV